MRNNPISFKANGTIAPSVFVKIDTSGDNLVIQSTANASTIGVSQAGMRDAPGLTGSNSAQAALSGDYIQVFVIGDIPMLTLGSGGCTAGDFLESDGSGNGVTSSTDGHNVGAIALQSGAASALVLVQVVKFQRGA